MFVVTLYWWYLPLIISILSVLLFSFYRTDSSSYFAGLDKLILVIVLLMLNMLMWLATLIWRVNVY